MRLTAKQPRNAFTLIELIVVMAIIVVLATLGIGAMSKSFTWIKQKNTEQNMSKVMMRLQKVVDRLYKEADDWPSATESRIFDEANGSMERARVIKILYLYKWSFPNTYAEAFHNVQESRQLYDPNGYPPARALLAKLRAKYPVIPDPFNPLVPATASWAAGTPATPADTAKDIPWQSSACMLAAYTSANGSPDDFTSDEVVVQNLPVGAFDPSIGANNPNDNNPKLVDAWGTPYLFLRHGNFACSRHRFGGGAVQRSAWTMGLVRPAATAVLDFAPLEYILNPSTNQPPLDWYYTSYYMVRLQQRSISAYPSLQTKDSFDPTSLMKNNLNWRTAGASALVWLQPNLPAAGNNLWIAPEGGGNQHGSLFRCTFGVSPENTIRAVSDPSNPANPQINILLPYSPMVILSAGGDKLFSQWDDNLDSYRLQINVSGQQ